MKLLALTLMTLFCAGLTSVTAQNTRNTTAAAATTTVAPKATTAAAPNDTAAVATTKAAADATAAPKERTTAAPTTTGPSTLSPEAILDEQFRSCCVAAGVKSYCYSLCSYGGGGLLNISNTLYLQMCSPYANRIALCATRGRDESLCCASKGVQGLCLGVCSGNAANYPSQVLACASYYKSFALCYDFSKSTTTAPTPTPTAPKATTAAATNATAAVATTKAAVNATSAVEMTTATTKAPTTVAPKTLEDRVKKLEAEGKDMMSYLDDFKKSGYVKSCRICFNAGGNSTQCGGIRRSCSGWSNSSSPEWTQLFRDNTNYLGGCTYQWRVDCE